MAEFQPCRCLIYDCSTRANLIAGHYYCHSLWNKMKSNPNADYKYTKTEVRAEHARIVKCLKKNGYEHDSQLD